MSLYQVCDFLITIMQTKAPTFRNDCGGEIFPSLSLPLPLSFPLPAFPPYSPVLSLFPSSPVLPILFLFLSLHLSLPLLPKSSKGVWVSAVSSPSGLGRALPPNAFGAFQTEISSPFVTFIMKVRNFYCTFWLCTTTT